VRVWRGPSQPCVTEEDGEDEGGGGTCGGWLWLTALTGPMTGGSDGLLETRHIGYTLLRDISQYTPVLSLAANPNPMPKRGGGRRGASSIQQMVTCQRHPGASSGPRSSRARHWGGARGRNLALQV
jgi:hypothetical protein